MNRDIKSLFVVVVASALACTVGKDGKQGDPGVPCSGCVNSASLAPGAVSSAALGDGVVKTANIGAKAVTGAQLADGAVDAIQLAPNAVGTASVADGTITTSKIAAGAVDANALGAGSVTTAAIAPASVGATELASGAVLSGNIGAGAVGTAQLQNGAVGANQLANGAVTSAKIGALQVNEAHFNVQQLGVVSSTVDETVMSRFMGDFNGLTAMRVLVVVNASTGRGAPTGGAGTLTAVCNGTAVYTVALEGPGGRPWTHISPSFACSGSLDINVKATAANAPVVIRQLEILHGH